MKTKTKLGNQSWRYLHNALARSAWAGLLLLFAPRQGLSAAFQDLGFESPTFVPVPSAYVGSVDPAAALPGWTVFWGTNLAPLVLHDNMFLDSAGVSILDTNCSTFPYGCLAATFQGHFTVLLQGGFSLSSYPARQSVGIAQTGLIPASATNLLFDVSGYNFSISVAGQNLPFYAVASYTNFVRYALDISLFSGQTVEIKFTAYPFPPPGLAINNVYLDDIRFPGTIPDQYNYITTNGAIIITGYTGPGGAVTIPNTIDGLPVTGIADGAFSNCVNITSVSIPNGVTRIGNSAFFRCRNMARATIPDSVTSIGDLAFYFCTSLTSVTIPNGVTTIADGTFEYCGGLAGITIGNNVTSIGRGAFDSCTSLTNVTIPSSVTNIGYEAFFSCSSLTAFAVDALNPVYSSVAGVLFDKSQTALILCPPGKAGTYAIPNTVSSIASYSFQSCFFLTSITIPNSVTSIGDDAFRYCGGLTNVMIPNSITNIGYEAFGSCGLTSITIGNRVTSIPGSMFIWCGNLTSVTVPNSVTSIGWGAFYGCESLASITIPSSVTGIADWAFYGCNLAGVYFMGNAPSLGESVFSGDTNAIVYYLPGTTGWGPTFGGRPTALWLPSLSPQNQTAEVGSGALFRVTVGANSALGYQWFFTGTTRLTCTNSLLQLINVQCSQAGAYTVVVTNAAGSVTSSLAMLNVIAPAERRPVPGINLIGETGSFLNVEFAGQLDSPVNWLPLDTVSLISSPQFYFDTTVPLPPQRFYRAWQPAPANVVPSLGLLHMVPALTLTGNTGDSLRVDYINQFGPTDAWVTLDTVTLTNTSQLYFDTSSISQPPRLWRIVPLP